jgi:hypothetical protein
MSFYQSDREFSNFVHDNIAKREIYPDLKWVIQDINTTILDNVDIHNAVDYFAINTNNNIIITIQERFRESKYSNYNDFTLRYKREFNKDHNRLLSEFFKLNVDYFVYGIINDLKTNVTKDSKFIKYAVIDVKKLLQHIDEGKILINEATNDKICKIEDNIMICPVIQNYDKSSSFVPFDIKILIKLYSDVIFKSVGF